MTTIGMSATAKELMESAEQKDLLHGKKKKKENNKIDEELKNVMEA